MLKQPKQEGNIAYFRHTEVIIKDEPGFSSTAGAGSGGVAVSGGASPSTMNGDGGGGATASSSKGGDAAATPSAFTSAAAGTEAVVSSDGVVAASVEAVAAVVAAAAFKVPDGATAAAPPASAGGAVTTSSACVPAAVVFGLPGAVGGAGGVDFGRGTRDDGEMACRVSPEVYVAGVRRRYIIIKSLFSPFPDPHTAVHPMEPSTSIYSELPFYSLYDELFNNNVDRTINFQSKQQSGLEFTPFDFADDKFYRNLEVNEF